MFLELSIIDKWLIPSQAIDFVLFDATTFFSSILFPYTYEVLYKGAGSYLGQGGANRAKGASWAPKANRGQRGRNVQERYFAMFCYYNSLLVLAQSKH